MRSKIGFIRLRLILPAAVCLTFAHVEGAFGNPVCEDAFDQTDILANLQTSERTFLDRVTHQLQANFLTGLELPPHRKILFIPDLKVDDIGTSPVQMEFPLLIDADSFTADEPVFVHETGHQLFYYNIEKSFKLIAGLRAQIDSPQLPTSDLNQLKMFTSDIQEVYGDLVSLVFFDSDAPMNIALKTLTQKDQLYRRFTSTGAPAPAERPLDPHDTLYDVRIELGQIWNRVKTDKVAKKTFLADVLQVIGGTLEKQFSTDGPDRTADKRAETYIQALRAKFGAETVNGNQ